jgi:alpha-tubulin suppressor-like RCC1 family protein
VVTKVVHVSAGLQFTVMLDVNGLVWTFGSNDHGQLCQVSYLLADAV